MSFNLTEMLVQSIGLSSIHDIDCRILVPATNTESKYYLFVGRILANFRELLLLQMSSELLAPVHIKKRTPKNYKRVQSWLNIFLNYLKPLDSIPEPSKNVSS